MPSLLARARKPAKQVSLKEGRLPGRDPASVAGDDISLKNIKNSTLAFMLKGLEAIKFDNYFILMKTTKYLSDLIFKQIVSEKGTLLLDSK
ncbi:hypothetical protein KUF54_07555 [Comamonas sp. Y33R10-2]|uniref:hypothetical protein n=1 Tax=Comamonas sp. Y33R10-2 TaxID=2853257 RepID=UPI001C5C9BFB|nr:hypothetical protein [Comamonas sp. Y33R10-2]QXZ11033.1 hypothetical protein KUF54_07555 [Comamonas sp. Y33R10-2]